MLSSPCFSLFSCLILLSLWGFFLQHLLCLGKMYLLLSTDIGQMLLGSL